MESKLTLKKYLNDRHKKAQVLAKGIKTIMTQYGINRELFVGHSYCFKVDFVVSNDGSLKFCLPSIILRDDYGA